MSDDDYDHGQSGNLYDKAINWFHFSRIMFVIKDEKLILGPENVDYSHLQWFRNEGWASSTFDPFMETVTRGYYNSEGLFFYKGYDFRVDSSSEEDILNHLEELVEKSSLNLDLHLFGGKQTDSPEYLWPPINDYGSLRCLL